MKLRPLVFLMCALFAGPTNASAKCVVKGKVGLTVTAKAKVKDDTSKISGTDGGKVHLKDYEVHTPGLFRTRIGSFTKEGPMVERARTRARPIKMEHGRATVKRGAFSSYTFKWDPAECTTSEAALGAIHLTWYLDERDARIRAQ